MVLDQRSRTSQKVVGLNVVLIAMHADVRLQNEGRPHGIGSFGGFGPTDPWAKRYFFSMFDERTLTAGAQNSPRSIRQNNHAAEVTDPFTEHFNDRSRLCNQARIALKRDTKVSQYLSGIIALRNTFQTQVLTTRMRLNN